jgi:hypothetical protein
VAGIVIAEILCDDAIAAKIRDKHRPLTFAAVRQALIYARDGQAGWDEDDEHGRRLLARSRTYAGRRGGYARAHARRPGT